MKCQVIVDSLEVAPQFADCHDLQDKIERREIMRNGETTAVPFFRKGAELEGKDVHWLVRQGVAIPADDDCRIRCRRSVQQMEAAQKAYKRLEAGIEVEDYQLYDDGVITGYNPDGSYKLGPNGSRLQEYIQAETEDEDDEV